jgi:hypothetical protein
VVVRARQIHIEALQSYSVGSYNEIRGDGNARSVPQSGISDYVARNQILSVNRCVVKPKLAYSSLIV